MPPARALVDAGAAIALATDFNPGSSFCESLAIVCLAGGDAAPSDARPKRSLPAPSTLLTCSAGPNEVGRLAPGYVADLVLLDATDWRYLSYHLGAELSQAWSKQGSVSGHVTWNDPARKRRARLAPMPSKKQRRRRAKDRRHEYEYVFVDD